MKKHKKSKQQLKADLELLDVLDGFELNCGAQAVIDRIRADLLEHGDTQQGVLNLSSAVLDDQGLFP